jgi:subtilisin-like proprotein convertase family protein
LAVDDGLTNTTTAFQLLVTAATSQPTTFSNVTQITIPDTGAGTPYPSTITVSGMAGVITTVTATLSDVNHDWSRDSGALLVSPSGQTVGLYTAIGGGGPLTHLTFTFSDAAAQFIPHDSTLTSGTWKPADWAFSDSAGLNSTFFPPPAPPRPAGTFYSETLADFNGQSPNGVWSLYVADGSTVAASRGVILGGWSLTIATSGGTALPSPTLRISRSGAMASIQFLTANRGTYTVEFKNALTDEAWTRLSAVPGNGGEVTVSDTITDRPTRFYRVRVE